MPTIIMSTPRRRPEQGRRSVRDVLRSVTPTRRRRAIGHRRDGGVVSPAPPRLALSNRAALGRCGSRRAFLEETERSAASSLLRLGEGTVTSDRAPGVPCASAAAVLAFSRAERASASGMRASRADVAGPSIGRLRRRSFPWPIASRKLPPPREFAPEPGPFWCVSCAFGVAICASAPTARVLARAGRLVSCQGRWIWPALASSRRCRPAPPPVLPRFVLLRLVPPASSSRRRCSWPSGAPLIASAGPPPSAPIGDGISVDGREGPLDFLVRGAKRSSGLSPLDFLVDVVPVGAPRPSRRAPTVLRSLASFRPTALLGARPP